MKKGFGILLLILGAAVFLVFITSTFWMPPKSYMHTGKGLFTLEQYQDFKEVMASESITITNVDILDDNYPILISYKFTSLDKAPLYNEHVEANWNDEYVPFALLSLIGFIPGIILLGESAKEERK